MLISKMGIMGNVLCIPEQLEKEFESESKDD